MTPRISIVTPCYNQGSFVEETLRSVLDQNYPNLEYVVMDGGSTDGSVEIIRRHSGRLTSWVSEKDEGQYDAINKGFAKTSGEIMAWINSDDKYLPWTFSIVGEIFLKHPEIEWITSLFPLVLDKAGRAVSCEARGGFCREGFLRGEYMSDVPWWSQGWIMQEATFWRRSLWERAGGRLDPSIRLAADFELWARFYQHSELHGATVPLAGFRRHSAQKTALQIDAYHREATEILRRHGGRPRSRISSWLLTRHARLLAWLSRRHGAGLGPRPDRHLLRYEISTGEWTSKR